MNTNKTLLNALKTRNIIADKFAGKKNHPALPLFACMFVYLRGIMYDIPKYKRVKNMKRTSLNHN